MIMRKEEKCLVCYEPLGSSKYAYHPKCSMILFGQKTPPVLSYALSDLEKLAEGIIRNSVTVPGVQEKISLHLEETADSAGKLTLVGLWGDYILKPPVRKYPEMPEVEDLTMKLASALKIRTVPHGLIRLKSGELAYITRRLDRDGKRKVCNMEDMCQLTERLTEDKYRSSMEKIGKAISLFSSHPMFDISTFFDISLFCFITGNADMHLKNFSLYYETPDLIQLAPAYDLLSTRLLIPEKNDSEEMALSLNGKKAKLKRHDFNVFAASLGLNEKQAGNAYARAAKHLPEMLQVIDKGFISDAKKDEFRTLIEDRAHRLGVRSVTR